MSCFIFLMICSDAFSADKIKKDLPAQELYAQGMEYISQGKYTKALPCFRQAVKKDPEHKQAQYELARTNLACQNFKKGFGLMHEYLSKEQPLEKPWHGQDLSGKRIVVYASDDVHDLFFCSRFLKTLADRGATVMLFGNNPVINFFGSVVNNILSYITITENNCYDIVKNLPNFDYEVHLMSLPVLLGYESSCDCAFFCDKQREEHWKNRLAQDHSFKVGICLKSLCGNDIDARRAVCDRLKNVPGITLYCLETDDQVACQMSQSGCLRMVCDEYCSNGDCLAEMAALMKNLDLVIAGADHQAQIAAGLKIPAYVMVPCQRTWHYCSPSASCRWYSKMTFARQSESGCWKQAINYLVDCVGDLARKSR